MGAVGGGPMIGNNRSTSTPNGGKKKFHEHQTMVLWIGGRAESLVGSVINWDGLGDHGFVCFVFVAKHLPSNCFFSLVFIYVWVVVPLIFVYGVSLIQ